MGNTGLSQKKSERMEVDFNNPYPPAPREVFLDLNNTCNLRCFFCSNPKINKRSVLDKKLGFRLLKEFFDFGTKEIALYANGEPFLRQDLADFVQEAKQIGYEYIFISTNGILAVPERAKPVLDAGIDSIKFSVNASSRSGYKQVHGVDCFDRVIDNIKWFHSYRKDSGLNYKIYVSTVLNSKIEGGSVGLRNLLSAYIDEFDDRGCSNQGGNMLENNLTEKVNPKNLLGSLKENQYTNRCPDIFFRSIVTAQGYLSACVADYQNYLIIADLNNAHIKDAWHCDEYVNLRKRHINGDLKRLICNNCLNNCKEESFPLNPKYANPF